MWRADHSSRGVLPNVMRRCVWSRNPKNKETMARVGSQRYRKKKNKTSQSITVEIELIIYVLVNLVSQLVFG